MLTFFRKEPMNLTAVYSGPVPYPSNQIGKFSINFKNEDPEPCKLKVKARVNMHGIFTICSATLYEKVENAGGGGEEAMETETGQEPAAATVGPAGEDGSVPETPGDSQAPAANNTTDATTTPAEGGEDNVDVNMVRKIDLNGKIFERIFLTKIYLLALLRRMPTKRKRSPCTNQRN